MRQQPQGWFGRSARPVLVLALVVNVLVGAAPTVLYRITGLQFLPTEAWAASAGLPANAVAGLVAILLFGFLGYRMAIEGPYGIRIVAVVLLGPVILGLMLNMAVIAGWPMLYTAAFGDRIAANFHVAEVVASGNLRCGDKLFLMNMPASAKQSICGLDPAFLDGLASGQRVVVYGRGTQVGIFVDAVATYAR